MADLTAYIVGEEKRKQEQKTLETKMNTKGSSDIILFKKMTLKKVNKLQLEVTHLTRDNIKLRNKEREYQFQTYFLSFFLLLLILSITILAIKKFKFRSKIKFIESSLEVSTEFIQKKAMLFELLKSEAISKKEYTLKIKSIIHEASVKIKLSKLNEALNSKVISEEEFRRKSSEL